MTAVCREEKAEVESIQASDILYFAHPTGVKGEIQRVGCWRGQSLPRMRWKGRRAGLPTFPMHTCLLGLLSMLSNILLFMLSIWHRSPFGTKHALFPFSFLSLSIRRCFPFHVFCFCRGISSSSSYLMADGFVVGAVLFCHLILWGQASENDMAADWREDSEANTCLKVFGQTLPLGSLLQLPLLKGEHSMTAVGYEV